jgi:hypothetical protein
MSGFNTKRKPAIYAIVAWMIINAVFMALEVTVFNDAADLNNSILLVLWIISIAGLLFIRKYGAALATFTLIYAFSFNAFNLIYYGASIATLNGLSAITNGIAAVYMLLSLVENSGNK